MAERSKKLQSAVIIFALALLVLLLAITLLTFLPQDLSDIEGRNLSGVEKATPRDLKQVLKTGLDRELRVSLTEKEINEYLTEKIKGSQEGPLGKYVSYRGIWVRLNEGSIDLIFERVVFNRPHTIALRISLAQTIDGENRMTSTPDWEGGRLGQLPVREGYLHSVMSSVQEFQEVLAPEFDLIKTYLEGRATISITEDRIDFTPRESLLAL